MREYVKKNSGGGADVAHYLEFIYIPSSRVSSKHGITFDWLAVPSMRCKRFSIRSMACISSCKEVSLSSALYDLNN